MPSLPSWPPAGAARPDAYPPLPPDSLPPLPPPEPAAAAAYSATYPPPVYPPAAAVYPPAAAAYLAAAYPAAAAAYAAAPPPPIERETPFLPPSLPLDAPLPVETEGEITALITKAIPHYVLSLPRVEFNKYRRTYDLQRLLEAGGPTRTRVLTTIRRKALARVAARKKRTEEREEREARHRPPTKGSDMRSKQPATAGRRPDPSGGAGKAPPGGAGKASRAGSGPKSAARPRPLPAW